MLVFPTPRRRVTPLALIGVTTLAAVLAAGAAPGAAAAPRPADVSSHIAPAGKGKDGDDPAEDKPAETSDDPKAGSNAAAEVMRRQEPLLDAGLAISELDDGGLGGLRLDVPKNTLHVWWRGDVPAKVKDAIERFRAADGIRIEVGESRYSQRELLKATEGLSRRSGDLPELVGVAPAVEGSGLAVYVNPQILVTITLEMLPPGSTITEMPVVQQVSRGFDIAPWWAGSVAQPVNGGPVCSTGFAVEKRFLGIPTESGVIVAEHCAPGGGVAFDSGSGIRIGTAGAPSTLPKTDSLYVRAPGGSAARIYDGGVGVGEFSKPVVGVTGNLPGQYVCTSGAATGAHCDVVINLTNFEHVLAPSGIVVRSSLATQQQGRPAVGLGDSGGPVFVVTAADPGKVKAAGMINGGVLQTNCEGFGSTCFVQVTFTNIYYVQAAHDVYVKTS
ncbi:hypothetical protein Cme02nite_51140 [Catellatospora methionotrophica]|uniref:Uncharacterized protein n=1 Tax=Catellatospora methionotrophica TaxID=121620 RepID=A0A8J3L9D0_9ACTN|nr:hypothetical protein [Catellatospora methionotrophica]GIG16782.1 hypothetical protein Cme02nite_51140 [Catellatospora methionotrophica]